MSVELMTKEYMVFNIDNCAEDYICVYQFLDTVLGTVDQVKVPDHLKTKIYKYRCRENCGEEKCSKEKMFSIIAREMKKGSIEGVDHIAVGADRKLTGFLRVRHDENDATIEYMYLTALLYKFPELACFLYTEEDEKQKYAVFNKAEEFFYGFSEKKKQN